MSIPLSGIIGVNKDKAARKISAADLNNAVKQIEIAFASGATEGEVRSIIRGINTRAGSGDIEQLRLKALPDTKKERIAQSLKWVEDEDDMATGLVRIKEEFAIVGFRFALSYDSTTSISDEEKTKLIEDLNRKSIEVGIKKVVKDLLHDWFTTDNMILHWNIPITGIASSNGKVADGFFGDELKSFCTLSPGEVEWDNSLNIDKIFVPVPEALKNEINKLNSSQLSKQEKSVLKQRLIENGITQKWIDAVINPFKNAMVELTNDEGEYWRVITKNRKHYGLASPSMYTVFDALESRKMLNQGEFSAAFMLKHFILHATSGESITQGPDAGSRANWASQAECERLLGIISLVSKSMRIATNHTVEFNFVFPPKEIFNEEKFANCERRILNWAGVVPAVWSGTGSTGSEGYLGIKRMTADIGCAREEINDLFLYFFSREEVKKVFGIPEGVYVNTIFDEQVLKEPRLLLEEVKALVQQNMHDPKSALRELGRNPEIIMAGRLQAIKDNDETEVWEPIATPVDRFGNVINVNDDDALKDKGGRPANDGTTPDEQTRLQRPVFRQTENV